LTKVRLAIIGCGSITKHRHAPEAKQNPNVELVAVCDRNLDHAKAIAEKFKVGNVYKAQTCAGGKAKSQC